jgi:hypothetical protein
MAGILRLTKFSLWEFQLTCARRLGIQSLSWLRSRGTWSSANWLWRAVLR